uniref:phospholipase D-like domain-containing protein n=1 Tax=Stappia sp. TaxID=1870903 RepID=UPI003A9A505D
RPEVAAGFRVFDLSTPLYSPEARAIGETWFDLIEHTLRRGVHIRMWLSDFDCIVGTELHQGSWHSARQFYAAAELAGPRSHLELYVSLHPAEAGTLSRLLLWPLANKRLRDRLEKMSQKDLHALLDELREMPALDSITQRIGARLQKRGMGPLPLAPATHHQKLAVFDREKLYIGGLDLNERRYDTKEHDQPAEETWHDVQVLVEGAVVGDALRHLESFSEVVAGHRRPEPVRSGAFLRTLSRRRIFGPTSIAPVSVCDDFVAAHRRLAVDSQQLIYFETQYFRDRRLTRHLARAAQDNPNLRMILIVPAAPEEVAFDHNYGIDSRFGEHLQARAFRQLIAVFGDRLFIGSPVQRRREIASDRSTLAAAPIVYVHAKVSIFDSSAAIISSANLNGRSMRWDTEAGLLFRREAHVRHLRERLFGHWWPDADPAGELFDPATAQQAWAHHALANVNSVPERRHGFIVPYDLHPGEELAEPLPIAPEEMV